MVVGLVVSANNGNPATPPASASVFVPAILAGQDFTPYTAGSTRGVSQFQGRVASAGAEIVAVAAETGQSVPRAQFFVSRNGGRSWTLGTLAAAGGGTPAPGHPARFVAGGQGEWAAVGPDSVWTSPDGQAWTLASATGLPQQAGDQVTVLKRTSTGFIAAGANVPGQEQSRATPGVQEGGNPVIFLSADGTSWTRLSGSRLRLAAGSGRTLDIRLAAAYRNRILMAGDVAVPTAGGGIVRTGGAWLSDDGGRNWTPVSVPTGHGAQAQFSDAATTAAGFLLVRPAVVDGVPAADVYRSANGTTWTFAATLSTPAGFTPGLMNGGPDGAVLAGHSGRALIAFVSPDGANWRQTPAFGSATSDVVTGVAATTASAVVAARTDTATGGSQQLITVADDADRVRMVNLALIPGAVEPELAVNAIAAHGSTKVVVGSADGFPAAWITVDGGRTWHRSTGQTSAVLNRPGIHQLTSITHGGAGWLAVGGVGAESAGHPIVLVSADGNVWSAADGEQVFAGQGLSAQQAAAGSGGYVIVGRKQVAKTELIAGHEVMSTRTIAAAWWSAGLTGWHRAGDAMPGALDSAGASRQMLAVTATASGFVAVGAHGALPAAWTTPDGRNWSQADLPLPPGATSAVLLHVAADGDTVVATGMARTATGQVPFAARSADNGSTWRDAALPVPAGAAQVTALTAADGRFTATGMFGTTPGHQDVVVWTSPDGTSWQAATPKVRGLAGPGIQAITGLTVSGRTLTGVGFTASPAGEQPILWQFPIH